MTDKEKKHIEKIKRQIVIGECEKNIGIPVYISDLKVVLNLIEKQSKIINLMAEQLTTDIHSKEWVIDYYEREVEQ